MNPAVTGMTGALNHCLGVNIVAGMGTESQPVTPTNSISSKEDRSSPEYLAQLLKDKKQIQAFPNVFVHLERLLDEGRCN